MEIGGTDHTFVFSGIDKQALRITQSEIDFCAKNFVLKHVIGTWKECIVVDEGADVFYFRDKLSKETWSQLGRTTKNADDMLYVMFHMELEPPRIGFVTDGFATEKMVEELGRKFTDENFLEWALKPQS